MRIPRPAAEKLGVDRQDPDLDGLLFGLISRATGGCHEHAARLDHPQVIGKGIGLNCACSIVSLFWDLASGPWRDALILTLK